MSKNFRLIKNETTIEFRYDKKDYTYKSIKTEGTFLVYIYGPKGEIYSERNRTELGKEIFDYLFINVITN